MKKTEKGNFVAIYNQESLPSITCILRLLGSFNKTLKPK